MNFKYPFKNRKDVKKALLVLSKAMMMYRNVYIVFDKDKMYIYPPSYPIGVINKIHNFASILNTARFLNYCYFLLRNNKLITFRKYSATTRHLHVRNIANDPGVAAIRRILETADYSQ